MATIPVSGTAQAATTHGAGVSVSTLRSGARTFSLTGLMGSVIVQGDEIELWGSNDGGTTFQPLRSAPGAPVRLSFNNPEAVLNDGCSHYATRRVSVGAGSSLVAVGVNG